MSAVNEYLLVMLQFVAVFVATILGKLIIGKLINGTSRRRKALCQVVKFVCHKLKYACVINKYACVINKYICKPGPARLSVV